uniref:Uncharacterized protein n=1 Tax=Arundo donax TaxID=35708 RepID=A0A0A9F9Z9_ARUDO
MRHGPRTTDAQISIEMATDEDCPGRFICRHHQTTRNFGVRRSGRFTSPRTRCLPAFYHKLSHGAHKPNSAHLDPKDLKSL